MRSDFLILIISVNILFSKIELTHKYLNLLTPYGIKNVNADMAYL